MLDWTLAASQPKRNSVAAPQIRPWHGPMPQRVCSFASRQIACSRNLPKETSSQRQTMVSSVRQIPSVEDSSSRRAFSASNKSQPMLRRSIRFSPLRFSISRQPSNLPLDQRQVHAADPGRLALRKTHRRPRCAADVDRAQNHPRSGTPAAPPIPGSAPNDIRKQGSRKAHSPLPSPLQRHRFERSSALRCNRPAIEIESASARRPAILNPLQQLRGLAHKACRKTNQPAQRSLLTHRNDFRATSRQMRHNREQQRPSSCHYHAFPAIGSPPRTIASSPPAPITLGSVHPGKAESARERQSPMINFPITQLAPIAIAFRAQHRRLWAHRRPANPGAEPEAPHRVVPIHLRLAAGSRRRSARSVRPPPDCRRSVLLALPRPPHSPPRQSPPVPRQPPGCRSARSLRLHLHPLRAENLAASLMRRSRRWLTRHSKQIPIPHSGPRGSPLTDVRVA